MSTTLLPIAGILAVEIPNDSWDFELNPEGNKLRFWENTLLGSYTGYRDLPPGEWELLFTTLKMTEKDAKGVVGLPLAEDEENGEKLYENFTTSQNVWPYQYETAIESFHSLLRANGLDPKLNYAILKNKAL